MKTEKKHLWFWPYLLIAALVTFAYFPTFSGEFILDDRPLIENNAYVKQFQPVVSYLLQEDGVTDESGTGGYYHTGYYRPIINLTYSIDYKVWGSSASGFRATNLFLHIICCFVLYHFLQFLIGNWYAALAATLIFAIHPVNTESVSWIAARNNILVTLFSVSSLFFYIKSWGRRGSLMRVASLLTFMLAILSKEVGLMVAPLLFLYQRLSSRKARNFREELLSYLPFIIVLAAYFLLRKAVSSSFSIPLQMGDLWQRACFAPYLVLWNLKLILAPYGLHSFVVGYPSTCLNWQATAGFCYIAILGIFIYIVRKNWLMIFSVLSFHVALFPTLNLIPTSAVTLVSMRWLYFPMAFLSIAVAQAIKGLFKADNFVKKSILYALLAYLGAYSYVLNNSLWHNENKFFTQEVVHFGNYYYAGGLAENLVGQKNYQDAEGVFQLAIHKFPLEIKNYLNYSALLIVTGRPGAALVYLEKAKSLFMTRARQGQWFNNMGVAHFDLKKYEEALKYFGKAVTYCPDNVEYRTNLGGAYTAVGNYAKGVSVLEKVLETGADSTVLRKNLALTYIRMNRCRDAMGLLEKIPKEEWERHGIRKLYEEAEAGIQKRDVCH